MSGGRGLGIGGAPVFRPRKLFDWENLVGFLNENLVDIRFQASTGG
ncbi:hypothetical protein CASFOL_034778 [Castilleja foliolosa]|uniref:Photosystem II protein D1 n=1 Tax=Castilleja foliolosa TaxID=1961234 RepID=A0ABD3BQU9_9LAMI